MDAWRDERELRIAFEQRPSTAGFEVGCHVLAPGKCLTFGALTIGICAYQGFHAHRIRRATGARAVSAATTKAVVISSIAVLAADYVITSFLV